MPRKRNRYEPSPPDHQIEIERDGKTYKGYYSTYRNTLKVTLIGGGCKTGSISTSQASNKAVARIILGELITEQKRQ